MGAQVDLAVPGKANRAGEKPGMLIMMPGPQGPWAFTLLPSVPAGCDMLLSQR